MKHARNIKEMLNIPTGNRNATSGFSSLPDSQLFFGSQFWLDNSQSNSQDVNLSSRNSVRSSQEGSDPKVFTSYASKPLLFGDKCRTSGLLEKFEVDIKKAKEKNDRDLFARELQNIRDILISIQPLVSATERNTASCKTLFEKIDSFASALRNISEGLQSDISKKFDTLIDKLSSHKAVMTALQNEMQKHVDTTAELQSQLLTLTTSLESLREEHKGQKQMLEEALKLLNSLVSKPSAKPSPDQWLDSAVQTTPGLQQSVSNKLQKTQLRDTQLTYASSDLKQPQVKTSLQVHRHGSEKKSYPLRGYKRKKKSPVSPQRSKTSVSKENCQHVKKSNKPQNRSKPLRERHDENTTVSQDSSSDGAMPVSKGNWSSLAAGCFITPLSSWSQDSSSSEHVNIIEPILEKLAAESKMATPMKPGNLWDLFDSDF